MVIRNLTSRSTRKATEPIVPSICQQGRVVLTGGRAGEDALTGEYADGEQQDEQQPEDTVAVHENGR